MKVLFIADRLETLKPASDTSVAFAEAVLQLGGEVYWCHPSQVNVFGKDVVLSKPERVREANRDKISGEVLPELFTLNSFTHVMVRKDPPFDEHYKDLCWILSSQREVPVINSAEALLVFHEKSAHLHAAADGILDDASLVPSCVSLDFSVIERFVQEQERLASTLGAISSVLSGFSGMKFIVKPWLGHGGQGIDLYESAKDCLESLKKQAGKDGLLSQRLIVQPFLPEIHTEGDRRVLIVKGQVICDFVRLPPKGGIAANLAQGGSAVLRPLSEKQTDLCNRLGQYLLSKGILLAGVDLIGDRVTEVNITSPTGVRTFESLAGVNHSVRMMQLLLG